MTKEIKEVQQKLLTPTPRPLAPPAPHPIGQALDVGGANAVVSRVAREDYLSFVLIVRTVDDAPFPVFQRERAETRTHDDCARKIKKQKKKTVDSVGSGHCLLWIIQMD